MTTTAKKRSASKKLTPKVRGHEPRIEDVTVEKLVFESVKKGLSTGVGDVLTDGTLEETIHGATGLRLDLLDRDYEALGSGLFGTRVRCLLDGCAFRFTELSLLDDWHVEALFEHALIAEMREHTGPLKAQRGKVTRAEFILEMLQELQQPFRFICPELHRKQKTPPPEKVVEEKEINPKTKAKKASKAEPVTASMAAVGKSPGISGQGMTVKGHAATVEQLFVVSQALSRAQAVGASELSMTALVVALIFENDCSNPDPGNPGDRGALSLIDSTIHTIQKKTGSGTINPYDIGEVSEHFCTAGYTGKGGSNALARANPRDSPTHIAYLVQGPAREYPHTSEAEANKMVKAFLAGGGGGSFSGSGASEPQTVKTIRTATFEFSRGQPGQVEDTFTCALRLAEEVGWRFFVSGRNDIYFVNDDDLLKAQPRYVVTPHSEGFVKLTGDVEVGNRTVIVHGKHQPKPSEALLVVRANRWAAPPSCVIELDGWGPFDHPWLVETTERHLFDAEMTIHLRAPQHPLEEPKAIIASTQAERGTAGGGGGADAAVAAARRAVSEKSKYHYAQVRPYPGSLFGSSPRTMDCSAFVILCYKEGGLPDPNHTGYNGSGWTGSLIGHCTKVHSPQPGDFAFFGGSEGSTHHVNIYVGNGKAVSMGGSGDPSEGPASQMGPPGFLGYYRPH